MLAVAALPRFDAGRLAFAAAIVILAAGPVVWLINTWIDPAFDSFGIGYFCVFVALIAWSASSPRTQALKPHDERVAFALLALTAMVRLASQVLAIDTIGALALVIDVYAIARLASLDRRVRSISPFWLSAVFAFALPVERIVQRTIGYLLQDVSAHGACGLLSALFHDVRCAGVRIAVHGADVLVDIPCSGARGVIQFGFAFAILAALARPGWKTAAIGIGLALAGAMAGNVLRITLLASGVALASERLGFDVMAQPWHDLTGLVALGSAAPPLVIWARGVRRLPEKRARRVRTAHRPPTLGLRGAGLFLLVTLAVVSAPHRPADIAARDVSIAAPARIADAAATPLPLSARERAYFEQYGGAAVKAAYGQHALMLARTSSPLRHLHAPDECFRGLGFRVSYLGMRFTPVPSAQYRATAPDGRSYRVDVSFLSNRGHRVASVSEAVWIWITDRSTVWTAVQRISPEESSASQRAAFDAGVLAALDIPVRSP